MGFADWKKRSKQFTDLYGRFGQTHLGAIETACQAAFKAGEREGRKQVEAVAGNAIGLAVLAEREVCANICEAQAKEPECQERAQYCADAIRMRSNVEVQGPHAALSRAVPCNDGLCLGASSEKKQ